MQPNNNVALFRSTGQDRQTGRQRSDSIGRTVLQTVAQKSQNNKRYMFEKDRLDHIIAAVAEQLWSTVVLKNGFKTVIFLDNISFIKCRQDRNYSSLRC